MFSPNYGDNFLSFNNKWNTLEKDGTALKSELSVTLQEKVIRYRNLNYKTIIQKYGENLPSTIQCINATETTAIDWIKVEVGLRNNFEMVLGLNKLNQLVILGYTNSVNTMTNPTTFFVDTFLTGENITFIIPKEQRLPLNEYKEITSIDNAESGNFVVIRNKVVNYANDFEVILMYAEKLAEIQGSRFSLAIQSKVMTLFKSQINDESINQLIEAFYNGAVTSKHDGFFDPENDIFTMDNSNLSANMTQLKTEYQNTISELNTSIGINTMAVDKKSGVSPTEIQGNSAMVDLFGNGYLIARNKPLTNLNKRFKLELHCEYNQSKINDLVGEKDENDNDSNGLPTI